MVWRCYNQSRHTCVWIRLWLSILLEVYLTGRLARRKQALEKRQSLRATSVCVCVCYYCVHVGISSISSVTIWLFRDPMDCNPQNPLDQRDYPRRRKLEWVRSVSGIFPTRDEHAVLHCRQILLSESPGALLTQNLHRSMPKIIRNANIKPCLHVHGETHSAL